MTDVHGKIHQAKTRNAQEAGLSNKPSAFDPIKPVADEITNDSWLICFDEFQVSTQEITYVPNVVYITRVIMKLCDDR
jgi:predicted ATPase